MLKVILPIDTGPANGDPYSLSSLLATLILLAYGLHTLPEWINNKYQLLPSETAFAPAPVQRHPRADHLFMLRQLGRAARFHAERLLAPLPPNLKPDSPPPK